MYYGSSECLVYCSLIQKTQCTIDLCQISTRNMVNQFSNLQASLVCSVPHKLYLEEPRFERQSTKFMHFENLKTGPGPAGLTYGKIFTGPGRADIRKIFTGPGGADENNSLTGPGRGAQQPDRAGPGPKFSARSPPLAERHKPRPTALLS